MKTVLRFVFAALFAASIGACGAAPPAVEARPDTGAADIAQANNALESDDAVVRFSDILDQYRALNERLENVSARLQIANAPLCPVTVRDAGYSVHTLSDYPERLQQVAEVLLNVDEGLSVRTVRAGSSAARAGVQPGDRLKGLNGQPLPSGLTQQRFYETAAAKAFAAPSTRLMIARNNGAVEPEIISFDLAPETLCGYPAHVVFDEYVNGHTDGRAVWITSELMRTVKDDVNLALIVAHEMAHAIAGHLDLNPTDEDRKILELTADSMALVMLERAGFDIDQAIAYWMRADNPQRMSQSRSFTHPSITQRLGNFEAAKQAINLAKLKGTPLDFSILPPAPLEP